MRRKITVLGRKERIVGSRRLCGEHVSSIGGKLVTIECFRHSRIIDQRTSARIDEDGRILHRCQPLSIDQMERVVSQWTMQ